MSTSLANPRRTRIIAWPAGGRENSEQQQPTPSADSTPPVVDEQGTGQ